MRNIRTTLLATTLLAGTSLATPAWAIAIVPDFQLSVDITSLPTSDCAGSSCQYSGNFSFTNNTHIWAVYGFAISGIQADQGVQAFMDGNVQVLVGGVTPTLFADIWSGHDNGCAFSGSACATSENFLAYASNFAPEDLTHDLGFGTFTGFDFNLYDSQPIYGSNAPQLDPQLTFDITDGVHDLTCTANFDLGNGATPSCNAPLSTTVPEPASLSLLGAGLAFLGFTRRRRKQA